MNHTKIIAILIILVSSITVYCETNEAMFWKWFVDNQKEIFHFESNQTEVLDKLTIQLHKIDSNLTFEFGPILENKREFVISANGMKSSFPSVESLYNNAPKLSNWIFLKYRQRRFPLYDITQNGRTVKITDIKYLFIKDQDPSKIGIVLFIKNYNKNEKDIFDSIGYIVLDTALGEYSVEMQVGAIVITGYTSKEMSIAKPVSELPTAFDSIMNKKNR